MRPTRLFHLVLNNLTVIYKNNLTLIIINLILVSTSISVVYVMDSKQRLLQVVTGFISIFMCFFCLTSSEVCS